AKWRPVATVFFKKIDQGFLFRIKDIGMMNPNDIIEQAVKKIKIAASRPSPNFFFSPVSIRLIDREYSRNLFVQKINQYILSTYQEHDVILDCLESWLMNLANIKSTPDPIFTYEKLLPSSPITINFL